MKEIIIQNMLKESKHAFIQGMRNFRGVRKRISNRKCMRK